MNKLAVIAVGGAAFAASACVQMPGMPGMPVTPTTPLDARPMADIQARMNAPPNTALPPVASLSCEQMQAELGSAGAKMTSQLDPSLAKNAQEMQKAMQSQKPMTQAEIDRHQAQVNQSMAQVAASTQGIDLQRMAALNTEFTARKCKTPQ